PAPSAMALCLPRCVNRWPILPPSAKDAVPFAYGNGSLSGWLGMQGVSWIGTTNMGAERTFKAIRVGLVVGEVICLHQLWTRIIPLRRFQERSTTRPTSNHLCCKLNASSGIIPIIRFFGGLIKKLPEAANILAQLAKNEIAAITSKILVTRPATIVGKEALRVHRGLEQRPICIQ